MKDNKRIKFTYGATGTGALQQPLSAGPRKANTDGTATTPTVTTGGKSFDYNGLFTGIGSILGGLGGLFGGIFGDKDDNTQSTTTGNPIVVEQKNSNAVWIAVGVGALLVVGFLAFIIFRKKK